MKMLDRERRKKKSTGHSPTRQQPPTSDYPPSFGGQRQPPSPPPPPSFYSTSASADVDQNSVKRNLPPDNSNSIQTEIRTDDFVVRLLLSISLHSVLLSHDWINIYEIEDLFISVNLCEPKIISCTELMGGDNRTAL